MGRNQAGKYRDGLWLVELAPLVDPSQVVQAVAQVFGLSSNSDETLATVLKGYLARKQILIILDNFEHLLEAAPFVGEILAAAPQLTILVTSRERLHIYGELEYPVYPLSLPDLSHRETLQQILSYDSLKLFLQRAQAVRPGLRLNQAQADAAAQICIRLDGLPLALELAATQAKVYSFSQLAELLKANLANLPSGPAMRRPASTLYVLPSNGVIPCSARQKSSCLPAWQSSRAAARWRRLKQFVQAQTSITSARTWPPWSTRI